MHGYDALEAQRLLAQSLAEKNTYEAFKAALRLIVIMDKVGSHLSVLQQDALALALLEHGLEDVVIEYLPLTPSGRALIAGREVMVPNAKSWWRQWFRDTSAT